MKLKFWSRRGARVDAVAYLVAYLQSAMPRYRILMAKSYSYVVSALSIS